jgi:transglutaminase-like putative cysteine protease
MNRNDRHTKFLTGPWEVLHRLDIAAARALFERDLAENGETASTLRGLTIVAFMDVDHALELRTLSRLTRPDRIDLFSLALYEHVVVEMTEWEELPTTIRKLTEGMAASDSPELAYVGAAYATEQLSRNGQAPDPRSRTRLGRAPGLWLCGPFDNRNNISAYRQLPLERDRLDTLAYATGRNGCKAYWTWLDADAYGDFLHSIAVEDQSEAACLARAYFDLPGAMDVIITLGGSFSQRTYIDGVLVGEDVVPRNAIVRGGYRMRLEAGAHEIGLALGLEISPFQVGVLDSAYRAIPGLKWRRFGAPAPTAPENPRFVHPIFDGFLRMEAAGNPEPDAKFWKATVQNLNGYTKETQEQLSGPYERGELSWLETWPYYKALVYSQQDVKAAEILARLDEQSEAALVDFIAQNLAEQNWENKIRNFAAIAERFPGRFEFDQFAAYRPLLSGDRAGTIRELEELIRRYPNACIAHKTMADMYAALRDYPSALREIRAYAKSSQTAMRATDSELEYLLGMGDYQGVTRLLEDPYRGYPARPWTLPIWCLAMDRLGKDDRIGEVLAARATRYPYDLETLDLQWSRHNRRGEYDAARACLKRVHELKPTALAPYTNLDELHGGVSYDSLFGSVDPMAYWTDSPPPDRMGGNGFWRIIDRRQKLVLKSGLSVSDIHLVSYIDDETTASGFREMDSPVGANEAGSRLLTARRLRRGAPPVEGTVDEDKIVFRDLKPGDAVELRYRYWLSGSGDLWNHFWDSYGIGANYYQAHYEYAILSDRDDLRVATVGPVPPAETTSVAGFRRIRWQGHDVAAAARDMIMTPPFEEYKGVVHVSTVPNWTVVDNWYKSISEAVLARNPQADALAARLTAPCSTATDSVRALYDYTAIHIPYQAVDFNYSATVPRRPDDVITGSWGDCKDKAHLLIHLLRRNGFPAWPVLVSTSDNANYLPLPAPDFDHLIVCCLVDGDTLFLDPTNECAPLRGGLGSGSSGRPRLVVGWGATDTLPRLPVSPAASWWRDETVELRPLGGERFAFEHVSTDRNLGAGIIRAWWRGTPPENVAREIERMLNDGWQVTVAVDSARLDPVETTDSTFRTWTYGTVSLARQAVGATDVLDLPDWSFIGRERANALATVDRNGVPVDLDDLISRRTVRATIHLPESAGTPEIAAPVAIEDPLWTFRMKRSWDRGTRTLVIDGFFEIRAGYTPAEPLVELLNTQTNQFDQPLIVRRRGP